jgi:hypothetical protein
MIHRLSHTEQCVLLLLVPLLLAAKMKSCHFVATAKMETLSSADFSVEKRRLRTAKLNIQSIQEPEMSFSL